MTPGTSDHFLLQVEGKPNKNSACKNKNKFRFFGDLPGYLNCSRIFKKTNQSKNPARSRKNKKNLFYTRPTPRRQRRRCNGPTEGALEADADAPTVISEIMPGILHEHPTTCLHQKAKHLASKYIARLRVLRCNKHGDRFTKPATNFYRRN